MIVGLLLSGVTAFPLQTEMGLAGSLLDLPRGVPPAAYHGLRHWVATVRDGLDYMTAHYPFIAYGTDWLAFAHVLLAVLFVGPYRDPARNRWVYEFGLIACAGVIPLAMIAGPIRGIPFGWRCLDCSFGILAAGPLWLCRRYALALEVRRRRTSTPGVFAGG